MFFLCFKLGWIWSERARVSESYKKNEAYSFAQACNGQNMYNHNLYICIYKVIKRINILKECQVILIQLHDMFTSNTYLYNSFTA